MARIEQPTAPNRAATTAAATSPEPVVPDGTSLAAGRDAGILDEAGAAARPSRIGRIGLLAYVLVFALICTLPLAGLVLGYRNPNLEKRALSPLPALMADGRPNLGAMRAFDDFYADHFAFRTQLVSGWHQLNRMLLGQSGSDKVIAGQSGWLFFAETLPDYLASPLLSDAELRRLAATLSLQQEYLAAQGIDFYFTVAPNKNSIYPQFMPARYQPVAEQNNLTRWLAGPHSRTVQTIDWLTPLRQAAAGSSEPIYQRTDSHWNNLGARIGYETLMAAVTGQVTPPAAIDGAGAGYTTRRDWPGDLAVMLSPSGVEPDAQQYFDRPVRYRSQRPIRSFEDLLIQTTLPASARNAATADGLVDSGGLKLWMFRDSFANLLVPMLAGSFAAATFTREVPYNYTGIDKAKADVVILEIVERNLPLMLQRAPILPAPERPAPSESPGDGSGAAQRAATAPPAAVGSPTVSVERLLAEPGARMLKLAGRLQGGQQALDAIDHIFVAMKNADGTRRFHEATPIDETVQMSAAAAAASPVDGSRAVAGEAAGSGYGRASAASGLGLTAFIPAGGWQGGSQTVEIWYHQADGWRHEAMVITLP